MGVSNSINILLIEDDMVLRSLLRELLEKKGYNVMGKKNIVNIIKQLKTPSLSPDIDIVITDFLYKGYPLGEEISRAIKTNYPHVPIILISSSTVDVEDRIELLVRQKIVDEFLRKPFAFPSLDGLLEKFKRNKNKNNNPPRLQAKI